jgi:hypothetical protein
MPTYGPWASSPQYEALVESFKKKLEDRRKRVANWVSKPQQTPGQKLIISLYQDRVKRKKAVTDAIAEHVTELHSILQGVPPHGTTIHVEATKEETKKAPGESYD